MNILSLKDKSVWFKCGVLKNRHGKVIDGLYDGLLLIMEDETEKVFVASPDDIFEEDASIRLMPWTANLQRYKICLETLKSETTLREKIYKEWAVGINNFKKHD